MPSPITSEHGRLNACVRCNFKTFYSALLLFSLHWAIVLYLNSSYLEQFFSTQTISILYIVGSLITLTAFLSAPKLFTRIGNVRLTASLACLEILFLVGMALIQAPAIVLALFILHHAIVPCILFTLDTLMEGLIGENEQNTGSHRGVFLTIGGLMYALATLSMGFLVGDGTPHFAPVYLVSAGLLIPFLYIILRNFKDYNDPTYPILRAFEGVQKFWNERDIRNVFFAHFLLQLFFSWMVIYAPVYLATEMGYNWQTIGEILFVALLAYVILEYPVGYLADNYFGEKEMMALGFAIIGISVSWFVFLDDSSIINWMIVMFLTRVGASFVEVTTESYFFKHTQGKDTDTVGIFRIAQPLGYIVGPILGGILAFFFPLSFTFVILGLLMIPGLFFAMALHDTR